MLTPGDDIYPGQSGLGSIVGLSADNDDVYRPAYTGPRRSANPPYSLMEVELSSPNRSNKIETGRNETDDYFVDANDEVLIRENYDNDNNHHEIQVPDGRSWRTIYHKTTSVRQLSVMGVTPSFESAVVIKNNPQTGRDDYYLMSLEDGTLSEPQFGCSGRSVEAA